MGDARRHGIQRHPRLSRLDGRQPRRRPSRPRPPHAGLVGGRRSGPACPSTPSATSSCAPTCSVAARAPPARRRSIRPPAGPTARRSPSSPSATWCGCRPAWPTTSGSPGGSPSSAGRWAGCRCSSGASPTPNGSAPSSPSPPCAQATAQQIAWGAIGRRRDPARPALARWRLLRRAPGHGPARRGCPSPEWWRR